MNKISAFSLAILSAIALDGCALSSTSVRVTEIDKYSHPQDVRIRAFSASNMQTLGPVFIKTEDRCSVSDVAKAAVAKYKNVSDIVNIRMEETEVKNAGNSSFSCKYSALAVNYKSINPEEFLKWKDFFAMNDANSEATVEESEAQQEVTEEQPPVEENTEQVEENTNQTSNDAYYTR